MHASTARDDQRHYGPGTLRRSGCDRKEDEYEKIRGCPKSLRSPQKEQNDKKEKKEQKKKHKYAATAHRGCNVASAGDCELGNSANGHQMDFRKPPAAMFQGCGRSKWRHFGSSCLYVLVLVHVLANAGLAVALPHTELLQPQPRPQPQQRTPTTPLEVYPATTPTFALPDLVLPRRHYQQQQEGNIEVERIKAPLHPRFDTAFPRPRSTPLETTYSPQYYPPTTIDSRTVEPFTVPTMTINPQAHLQTFDPQKPLSIEKPAPNILSAPSDTKIFPLKNLPKLPHLAAADDVPPGVAIKPLQANICSDPISSDQPPSMFKPKRDFPVPKQGVVGMDSAPVGTNKFWQHLTIGDGTLGVWTQPYMVWVNKNAADWGLSISHTDGNQLANGPDPNANPIQYYINPLGLESLSLSAVEFNSSTSSMETQDLRPHSGLLTLFANKATDPGKYMLAYLVQGMGFVSGYNWGLTPRMNSVIQIRNLTYVGYVGNTAEGSPKTQKWRVTLQDGKMWMIYAVAWPGTAELSLSQSAGNSIQASSAYYGLIQIAKLPPNKADGTSFEYVLDSTAGAMPVNASFSSSINGATGTYTFNFQRNSTNDASSLLMYALPHHIASFDSTTNSRVIPGMQLRSTTKGMMTAVVSDSWTLVENNIPNGIGFLPGGNRNFGPTALSVIRAACTDEINDNIDALSNQLSQYYAGKALARYAQIVLVACDVLKDTNLARQGLAKLIPAFNRFAQNNQQQPLVYETTWKGIISSAPNQGDDFGNAWYNDHMFHYGYFIMAAAVLVHVDQTLNGKSDWLTANLNYVNTLVRDVANPSSDDKYFPVSRNFDYFHGHSWATGLFPRGDGKDLESTSEDCMFSYGMKLWGNIIGDANMEARGNLMLAIQRRAFNSYFYLTGSNKNQPANFVKNKVTGILFENKVDHTTYFSNASYCVQGIHMLPLIPSSPYIKDKQFSMDEWNYYFANTARGINNGWMGILYANAAIFAPTTSWQFFADPGFSKAWLDDGASKTWSLVFAAGLGGAPAN